jgi:O-antigen/teichoic acid export membrane protein
MPEVSRVELTAEKFRMKLDNDTLVVERRGYTGRISQTLFGRSSMNTLEKRVSRGAIGSFGLKAFSIGFSFFSTLILTRLLGATEYGLYAYVLAWVNFLCIPALIGLDQVVIRQVAAGQVESEWGAVRGLLRWSNRVVLSLSFAIALLAGAIAWALARQNSAKVSAFLVALVLLPLLTLTRLRQSAMQGLQHVIAGQLPESLVQPTIFISLILASHELFGWALHARTAAGLNALATGVALLVGAALLHTSLPQRARLATPVYRPSEWMSSALPLLLVNGIGVINNQVPILFLGAMKGAETAGLYAIAIRVADLLTFGLMSVNLALAPVAARLWAQKDIPQLQQVVTKTVRVVFIFTVPMAAVLVIFGEKILSIFGPAFTRGKPALVILVIGQLANIGMGSVALLLIMTGHAREVAIATGVCVILNISLNLIMIPSLGMVGTALAVSSSLIVWNVLLALWVYRRLAIHSTALGRINKYGES